MRELPEEELQSAARFVFLSMAIVVMEQDMKHIEAGGFKIKEPYLGLLAEMNDHAENEHRAEYPIEETKLPNHPSR